MKKLNVLIRKCKSLSRQLGRSSSFGSGHLRYSRSTREGLWTDNADEEHGGETVYVGSSRRQYVISSKYLSHPLINALIERSSQETDRNKNAFRDRARARDHISIKCEVVLFDHLLWMLENGDPNNLCSDQSLEELAELYMV